MRNQKERDEWEIREDARTLARAEEIKADKERLKEAQGAAKDLANEDLKRIQGILKVAGKKSPSVPDDEPRGNHTIPRLSGRYSNPATLGRL